MKAKPTGPRSTGEVVGKQVVLVSHNKLAEGMTGTVEMIFGKVDGLSHFCLTPDGNVVELGQKVRELALAHADEQTVVVADLMGGSVCNQCMQELYDLDNVKIVAGMSLPLVLGIVSVDGELSDADLAQAVDEARQVTTVVELPHPEESVATGEDDFF